MQKQNKYFWLIFNLKEEINNLKANNNNIKKEINNIKQILD